MTHMLKLLLLTLAACPLVFAADSISPGETAPNIQAENWLLFEHKQARLPYYSSMTIYPPVSLHAQDGELSGMLASDFSFSHGSDKVKSDYLVVVTDAVGKAHFLQPQLQNIGFVGEQGIGMATLSAQNFADGEVVIQLYKANTPANRAVLQKLEQADATKEAGIREALSQISLPAPELGQPWKLDPSQTQGSSLINNQTTQAKQAAWTIVQLYGQGCSFSRRAIPRLNQLHQQAAINVMGLAGPQDKAAFASHLSSSQVDYPFMVFSGEFAQGALTRKLGHNQFPTYFVLDENKKLTQVFAGTHKLEEWLQTLPAQPTTL